MTSEEKIIFLRQSTPEMLWNKQKARLNGGVPIFEKGADVLLLPKSRVRHHHQFKRPARQMTALESSPHQRTRITVEAFGQAGEPLGTQCWKVGTWKVQLKWTLAPVSYVGTSPYSLFFCIFQDISGVDWWRNIIFAIALFFWFLSTLWVPPPLQLEGSMPECPLELSPKNKTENGRSFLKSAAGCDAAATQTMACSFSEQIAFQAL